MARAKASNPGGLSLDNSLFREVEPSASSLFQRFYSSFSMGSGKLFGYTAICTALEEGDGDAAWVVSTKPPIVAAYSSELDAVVLLRMDPSWSATKTWKRGQRLLTVNIYRTDLPADPRIPKGPFNHNRWDNFFPVIPELVCSQQDKMNTVMRNVPETSWERSLQHAKLATSAPQPYIRDGRPSASVAGKPFV